MAGSARARPPRRWRECCKEPRDADRACTLRRNCVRARPRRLRRTDGLRGAGSNLPRPSAGGRRGVVLGAKPDVRRRRSERRLRRQPDGPGAMHVRGRHMELREGYASLPFASARPVSVTCSRHERGLLFQRGRVLPVERRDRRVQRHLGRPRLLLLRGGLVVQRAFSARLRRCCPPSSRLSGPHLGGPGRRVHGLAGRLPRQPAAVRLGDVLRRLRLQRRRLDEDRRDGVRRRRRCARRRGRRLSAYCEHDETATCVPSHPVFSAVHPSTGVPSHDSFGEQVHCPSPGMQQLIPSDTLGLWLLAGS